MPSIVTIGSIDSGHDGFTPGIISTPTAGMIVNGQQVAGTGTISAIHAKPDNPPHVGTVIGSSKVIVNGTPIAMVGDITGCGASIVSGDPTMQIT